MISYIAKLLKALNANTNPEEIAHGAACGFLLGLMPKDNLLWWVVFIFILFVRINKAAYGLALLLGSLLAPALDATFDTLGYSILTNESLYGLYGFLENVPFVSFTKFNNTVVMGSLAMGLLLYIPAYIIARVAVALWRKHAVALLRKAKIIKVIGNIPIVSKIASLVGEKS